MLKLKLQYFGYLMRRANSLEKTLMGSLKADLRREEKGMTLSEFEQTLRDSEGQGSLVCYSPWHFKELDT